MPLIYEPDIGFWRGFDSLKALNKGEMNMAMTWEELRNQIIDFGFEEDEIAEEYQRIIINAVNRALDRIRYSVIDDIWEYYKITESWGSLDEETGKWVLPAHEHIDADTEDSYEMVLPDNLTDMLPHLASYYVWLDDDITKATLAFNQYDQIREERMAICKRPRKVVIEGGW